MPALRMGFPTREGSFSDCVRAVRRSFSDRNLLFFSLRTTLLASHCTVPHVSTCASQKKILRLRERAEVPCSSHRARMKEEGDEISTVYKLSTRTADGRFRLSTNDPCYGEVRDIVWVFSVPIVISITDHVCEPPSIPWKTFAVQLESPRDHVGT